MDTAQFYVDWPVLCPATVYTIHHHHGSVYCIYQHHKCFLFSGRKEIWDALKAAAAAMESGDNSLAQAIIDGANIALPHGKMILGGDIFP